MLTNRTTYITLETSKIIEDERELETIDWVKKDSDKGLNNFFEIRPMTRQTQYILSKLWSGMNSIEEMFDIVASYVNDEKSKIKFADIDVIDLRTILDIWWSNNVISKEELKTFLS